MNENILTPLNPRNFVSHPKAIPIEIHHNSPDDDWWLRGYEKLRWNQPSTHWAIGLRHTGKSSLLEAICTNYAETDRSTIFDLYSASDNEGLTWLRSPYNQTLLIVGKDAKITSHNNSIAWRRINEFTLEEAEQYQTVIAVPKLFRTEYEQYSALSYITRKLSERDSFNKVNVLIIREAGEYIRSRVVTGEAKNHLKAIFDFIHLHNQAAHSGLAVCLDSLRALAIDISVREITNYVYFKQIGSRAIPKDIYHLLRHIMPHLLRRLPKEAFILLTEKDNIAIGRFNPVPWHIRKGEGLMKNLGIQVEFESKTQSNPDNPLIELHEPKDLKRKVTLEIHQEIIRLRNLGLSYGNIQRELATGPLAIKLNPYTIGTTLKEHLAHICPCKANMK